jgi:signal peptidase I
MMDDQGAQDWATTETGRDGKRPGTSAQAAAAEPADEPAGIEDTAGISEAAALGLDEEAISPKKKSRSFWRELPVLIVIALVIALLIKSFVVQAFYIPSPSMMNTLDIGDKVLVNKLVYHFRPIEPGDVIVFNGTGSWNPLPRHTKASTNPLTRLYDDALLPLFRSIVGLFGSAPGQEDYIKRVIGVPGDHVACCNAAGQVTVNGVPLREKSYLYPGNVPSTSHFSITVPPGRLWVMGDHRFVSYDSRGHIAFPGGGTIPESQVVGRAFMIVWPSSRWRILPIPGTFGQPGIDGPKKAAAAGRALSGGSPALAPLTPFLPLELGFAGAVPVFGLQLLGPRLVRRRRWRRASR